MPRLHPSLLLLSCIAGLIQAAPELARAQATGGLAPGSMTPGICSGGGCVPRVSCQDGTTLCSPFPDHPAYDPNVEFRKGAVALKAGDFKEAQREFGKVLYMAPTNSDVLFALGVADVGLGDLAGGAEAFGRALKWNPHQINATRELAITDFKLGQPAQASLQLSSLKTRAVKCDSRCAEAAELKDAIDAIETEEARAGASGKS